MKYSEYTKNDIITELEEIIAILGKFPTAVELTRLKRTSLFNAIYKHKYKLSDLKQELGHIITKKPDGYWKDFTNIENEIRPLIKNGMFPTLAMIKRNIPGGAIVGIRHFGGMAAVAQRMGFPLGSVYVASDGHRLRSSYEFLVDEYLYAKGIPHQVDGLICDNVKYRYDFKISNKHFIEIWGYRGRYNYDRKIEIKKAVYSTLGINLISIEAEFFQHPLDNIEQKLDCLMRSIGIEISCGRQGEIIRIAAERCGFWNEHRIKDELTTLIRVLGRFPTQKELQSQRNGLATAIGKRGGITYFRSVMGYENVVMPAGYWNDQRIIDELREVSSKTNCIPTAQYLTKNGHSNLLSAMSKRKGIAFYKEQLRRKHDGTTQ